ncbi:hypothetical protein [Streptobacillus moniliformis]|uniref:hypothetical protein n=1 Tax=Streptobacillus moniliformis TaxID=34105 RepID=UPI0007E40BDB|nr:hypothetical protein [Streptobacillus moniliformis]
MILINAFFNFFTSKVILTLNAFITLFIFIKNIKDMYTDYKGMEISELKAIYYDNTLIIDFKVLNLHTLPFHFTTYKFGNLKATSLDKLQYLNRYSKHKQEKLFKKLDSIYGAWNYEHLTQNMSEVVIQPGFNQRFHFVFNNVDKYKLPKVLFLHLGVKKRNIKISPFFY